MPHPSGGGFNGAGIELDAVGQHLDGQPERRRGVPHRVRPADLQRRAVADGRPRVGHRCTRRIRHRRCQRRLDRARAGCLSGDRRRPDERSGPRQRPGAGRAPRPGLPAGHQRRRLLVRRPGDGHRLREPTGVRVRLASATRAAATASTGSGIAGTTRDPLYQNLRVGHDRLPVRRSRTARTRSTCRSPSCRRSAAGDRIFSVAFEDAPLIWQLDVASAAGGRAHGLRPDVSWSRSPTASSTSRSSRSLRRRSDRQRRSSSPRSRRAARSPYRPRHEEGPASGGAFTDSRSCLSRR